MASPEPQGWLLLMGLLFLAFIFFRSCRWNSALSFSSAWSSLLLTNGAPPPAEVRLLLLRDECKLGELPFMTPPLTRLWLNLEPLCWVTWSLFALLPWLARAVCAPAAASICLMALCTLLASIFWICLWSMAHVVASGLWSLIGALAASKRLLKVLAYCLVNEDWGR